MIYDSMDNFGRYAKLAPKAWQLAAEFYPTVNAGTKTGRYHLDGDLVMADVLNYSTKPLEECKVELHQRYIDIQVLVSGAETIYCLPTAGLDVLEPMNVERDRGFFVFKPGKETALAVRGGEFALFFPGEGHLTGFRAPAEPIIKIVFKVDSSLIAQ